MFHSGATADCSCRHIAPPTSDPHAQPPWSSHCALWHSLLCMERSGVFHSTMPLAERPHQSRRTTLSTPTKHSTSPVNDRHRFRHPIGQLRLPNSMLHQEHALEPSMILARNMAVMRLYSRQPCHHSFQFPNILLPTSVIAPVQTRSVLVRSNNPMPPSHAPSLRRALSSTGFQTRMVPKRRHTHHPPFTPAMLSSPRTLTTTSRRNLNNMGSLAESPKSNILIVGSGGVGTMAAYALEKGGKARVTAVLRSNYAAVEKNGFVINSLDHGDIQGWRPSESEFSLSTTTPIGAQI